MCWEAAKGVSRRRLLQAVVTFLFLLTVAVLVISSMQMSSRPLLLRPGSLFLTSFLTTSSPATIATTPDPPHLYAVDPAAKSKKVACITFMGRLGNMLFQYAFLYKYAKIKNLTMLLPDQEYNELRSVVRIPEMVNMTEKRARCMRLPIMPPGRDGGFQPHLLSGPPNVDRHVKGFYLSWKYWADVEDDLRYYFRPTQKLQQSANQRIAAILSQHNYTEQNRPALVGVHIRRGDYLKQDNINFGYMTTTAAYLRRALTYIRERVKRPLLPLVCSDDLAWSREALQGSGAVFLEGGGTGEDFALLSSMEHLVTTTGTFGWWAAWRVRGHVTFFYPPFRPRSELEGKFTPDYNQTFFYPGWAGLGG